MNSFFSKYSFLVIWILVIIIVGALFVLVVQPSLHFGSAAPADESPITAVPAPAPVAPSPSVTLTIEKSKSGNSLFVQWANLPGDTTALNIFRGLKNSTSGWSLWQTLHTHSRRAGQRERDDRAWKKYACRIFILCGSGKWQRNRDEQGRRSGFNPAVLWTSSVSDPTVTTSTPPSAPGTNNGGHPTGSSNVDASLPCYEHNSRFVFDHASFDHSPANAIRVPHSIILRCKSRDTARRRQIIFGYSTSIRRSRSVGRICPPPRTALSFSGRKIRMDRGRSCLTQQNPGVNCAYSIQVVDDTLGTPYFYEMNAVEGSTTIATYGPVYLQSNQ